MATLFTVDIEKKPYNASEQYWSNNYHIKADDLASAHAMADIIVQFEIAMHTQDVYFTKYRVSKTGPDDTVFATYPINTNGLRAPSGNGMPLYLAMRLDLVPSAGYAGRKFYHLTLNEGDQDGGVFTEGFKDTIEAIITTYTSSEDWPQLYNPSGTNTYDTLRIYDFVASHQFKRGSRRRTEPIL